MDFSRAVDTFKKEYVRPGEVLRLSQLPILIDYLKASGLDFATASGEFYQELSRNICSSESSELQSYVVDLLQFCGRSLTINTKRKEESPAIKNKSISQEPIALGGKQALQEEDGSFTTEHLTDDIPAEDSEGDPFFVPEDQRLTLKPEDISPMKYDRDFCEMMGIEIPEEYR